MMMMIITMVNHGTNKCHKCVALIRFIKDGDDDNDDVEVPSEYVSQVCDTYSLYERCWW